MAMACSLRSTGITPLHRYYKAVRPCAPHRYSRPRGWSRLRLLPSRHQRDRAQVLTFRTKAWSSFAPPTCRMSLEQSQESPELIPEEDAMGRAARTMAPSSLSESTERLMPQQNDLSRSLVILEQDATLIPVIEMGQSSWLVAGIVPGVERSPLKKLAAD